MIHDIQREKDEALYDPVIQKVSQLKKKYLNCFVSLTEVRFFFVQIGLRLGVQK